MNASASPESEPYLRIEGLTKKFGAFTALADIDLDVYPGELLCFLGPSGCGKTTLLRCIAGLDVQTRGRVIQAGKDISTLPPTERDFGIVFQTYALFPNLTVYRNIAYGLENRKIKKADIEKRAHELLDLMGIPAEMNKYPAQLSGGQQQRVALARALATWPGLLLLDEPLSALDAKVRVYLRYEIRRLQRQLGVTTIMVTHDQEEALTMGDRIVVMNQGVIVQVGTPVELYREPATPFVAHFLGTMNSLPGVVVDATRVRVGKVELKLDSRLDGLAQGAPVTVCVRPEDLTPYSDGPRDGNSVSARVSDLEFLGAFYRATLSVNGMSDHRITADIRPNVVQEQDIREGADLTLAFPADRMRIFASEEGG
ncbi:MAG TPA: putative 2-aminoethylphosphonate ABC transporter ATP-binding protein [Gammaproteobacteria bacterium]|nr:putative 2-aminoethylphosphonate ABC transporter ATP-binding protein [Gammaproteobacteria bacterium]